MLLLAAVWLLVPFALKLVRALVAGCKLRQLPGPRGGLAGVTPILKVASVAIHIKCKRGIMTCSAESHPQRLLCLQYACALC